MTKPFLNFKARWTRVPYQSRLPLMWQHFQNRNSGKCHKLSFNSYGKLSAMRTKRALEL